MLSLVLVRLLETADQAFIGHLVYYYSISNYAKPVVLLRATMTWSVPILLFYWHSLTLYSIGL